MDNLLNLLNIENLENEEPKPYIPKKSKKRRASAAAFKKLQAKMAEELRQHQIKQRQEYLKETKARVHLEWQQNRAKALIYEGEFLTRLKQLDTSFERLTEVDAPWVEYNNEKRKHAEWALYMECDQLPNPTIVSQINSYIFVWTEVENNNHIATCMKKMEEVMKLLTRMDKVIDDLGPYRPPKFLNDIKGLRNQIRNLMEVTMNKAAFNLFSKIECDMKPINVTTSKSAAKCPYFNMSMWAELMTPLPSNKGKELRQTMKVVFEETEVTVILPVILLDFHKVIRVLWYMFDHWSDSCPSYECPPLPSFYNKNLRELLISEFETKTEVMKNRAQLELKIKKNVITIPPDHTLSQEIAAWDSEPQRALSDEILFRECDEEENLGRRVKMNLNEFEVNLRERTILGDILCVDIFYRPPQPKYLRFKHNNVTLREEAPELLPINYFVKYPPPPPPPPPSEEEGEEDDNEDPERMRDESHILIPVLDPVEEYNKLLIIQLKLCPTVIWFEAPQVANWDPIHGYWSSEHIHDLIYDDEDGTLTFKTGLLGKMSLHVNRYCNLPYLDWMFEPSGESHINFYLKTSKTELRFKIREGEVCLEWMKTTPNKMTHGILDKYYSPKELLTVHLKKIGIDVFPAPDASCYIGERQSKHFVLERHIYLVWALFHQSFKFKYSKFNQVTKRSVTVFQAQELYPNQQVDFCLIHAALYSAFVLDINEDAENYSPEPAPFMKTFADLYGLLYHNSTMPGRRQSAVTGFLLVQTVKEFLCLVRPLSFG